MTDVSVLITARNEEFLSHTVEDVLVKRRGDTEIVVILDGAWAKPEIKDHADITIVYHKESVGQRAAINEAARLSRGKYIMKLDAHCIMDEGFDVKLMADYQPQQIVIPAQYNLHAFNWRCKKCGNEWYQGPTPTRCQNPGEGKGDNPNCDGKEFEKVTVWQKRDNRRSEFYRFDSDLHFQYWGARKNHPESQGQIAPTMTCIGACWFMEKSYFWELDGMDEEHGSWGQMGTELACKTWLYGGSMVTNKNTWYAHLFRTQGGDFSFPYPQSNKQVDHARKHSQDLWKKGTWPKAKHKLHWLVEKFWPVPGWDESSLRAIGGHVGQSSEPKQDNVSTQPYFRKVPLDCVVCGRRYEVKPSREEKSKCCSRECLSKYKSELFSGRQLSDDWKKRIGEANKGELHGLWKGDDVGYKALHDWVYREKGSPKKCQWCGSTENMEWANKSRDYKRDANDWLELCKKCHWRWDNSTRGVIYYTDNQLNVRIAHAAQSAIKKTGLPIVSSSLKPMELGKNVVTDAKRGYVTMFKQILSALEALDTKYVFFCEHDVIYHPSHFDFIPPKDDVWYYNINLVKVNAETGKTVKVDECKQVSGICVNRELAVAHYRKRMEMIEDRLAHFGETDFNSWIRKVGFEPGTHNRPERVDDSKSDVWESEYPNLDIRHSGNLTATRWSPEQYVNKKFAEGWTEGTILNTPGWTKKDFNFLKLG